MKGTRLRDRDYEILRTLVRVQLATTASLQRVFFSDLRLARRRLLTLRSVYGFITPHSRGLPGNFAASGGQYWKLTEAGLQQFAEQFPNERIPDNHIRRSNSASLRFFDHRDSMTDLYLRLIESKDRNIGEIQSRADVVDWRGEFEAVLQYTYLDGVRRKQRNIIPDATLSTPHARYFLEIDRSTESREHCRRMLKAYSSALEHSSYREQFPDSLSAVVVYVTKSRKRAEGLGEVIDSIANLPFRGVALPMEDATGWLCDAVTEPPGAVPAAQPSESKSDILLRRFYDDYCGLLEAWKAGGVPTGSPSAMEVYEYLLTIQDGN